MRDYIFRGKRIPDGKWVYGSLVKRGEYCAILEDNDADIYMDPETGVIDGNLTPVDPETVGERTGLTDKNGKRIFEGDIVDGDEYCDEDGYGVVTFDDGAFEVGNADRVGTFHENYYGNDFDVIGNIHDNPELLEAEHG